MPKRLIAATAVLLVACGTPRDSARAQTSQAQQAAPAAGQPAGNYDELLAPVALYPDALLAQMLLSSSDPAKIGELDKWLKRNTSLKGTQLQDACVKAGFDASFVALAIFPTVVEQMASKMDWTMKLGHAFATDKTGVFASIQRLRKQAQSVGTLKDSPQQNVETKTTSGGEQVVVIESANPQVVYVPQYNPQVVYTQAPTTTVVVQEDDDSDEAVAAGLIGFTAGIAIGASMNNSYYYGPYGYHGGVYMYNDAWDDYYDHREDAREDYVDHREDVMEERTDRSKDRQEQRSDRTETRAENRPENAGQRAQQAQQARASGATASASGTQRSTQRTGSTEARGVSGATSSSTARTSQRSSDAFSGYSSGSSQRSASSRGASSRASSGRSRGGGGGGGRRR